MAGRKQITIKFDLTPPQEAKLRTYINNMIITRQAEVVKMLPGRQDVRIRIQHEVVPVQTQRTRSVGPRRFEAGGVDLSSGGICLAIDDDIKLSKGVQATVVLDFVEEGFTLSGSLLGLAKRSPK